MLGNSKAVVVNSNMSRGKYLAREGPGSRLSFASRRQQSQHPSHPCAIIRPLRFMHARGIDRPVTFGVHSRPPFSGKKRTQFSKFEVVKSKYRRFNRARWQLTATKCNQKFAFGRNSTSRFRGETKDVAAMTLGSSSAAVLCNAWIKYWSS